MFHLSQNYGISFSLEETLARVNKRTDSEEDVQKMRAIPPPSFSEEVGISKKYAPRKRNKKRKTGDMTVEDAAIAGNGTVAFNNGFEVLSNKALEHACRHFPVSAYKSPSTLPQAGSGASTGAITLRHKARKSYVDDDDDEPLPGGKIDEWIAPGDFEAFLSSALLRSAFLLLLRRTCPTRRARHPRESRPTRRSYASQSLRKARRFLENPSRKFRTLADNLLHYAYLRRPLD
ncbi:hypothetical protein LTR37_007728 [Vermiconidia calcicola]|uniref:Uncharacterized protein n=1 Tax=Vermiconidia calcicola TaxID=1690605 RepID=A0ACC3ND03_9PEZI|nr:hypothetical protein LTR37_007728 [Vermiconidia calcicola]